ncbi:ADI_G0044930.mRNA.1.CDS.1 [Saccharomyces cerevisiae]|nr:ADI_G0044930.mRNA.1.CDS.1 [Saccharomyces cerevisiae]CAI6858026.1 ADI_G0044930.mRNA.1.CDS.1 [Saccharomyces cerevisiae]
MSYSFLDFGLTKLNIFSSMVLTYTSAQREYSHNTDYARAVKRCSLCVCWAGQKVSYRRMAWEALAVERMLRNDEEYKEYFEDIEPYHGDPVGYLKYFSVKRERSTQIQRNYAWYLAITRRRETISVLDSTRGKQGSRVFRMSGRQIKELYFKVWSNLRESKTEVLQYFFELGRKKVPGRMGGKRRYGRCRGARETGSFSAFAFHDKRWTAGSAVCQAAVWQASSTAEEQV